MKIKVNKNQWFYFYKYCKFIPNLSCLKKILIEGSLVVSFDNTLKPICFKYSFFLFNSDLIYVTIVPSFLQPHDPLASFGSYLH